MMRETYSINNSYSSKYKIISLDSKLVHNKSKYHQLLDDIIFDIEYCHPKEIIVDITHIKNINETLLSEEFYLRFLQFLILFNINRLIFIVDHKYNLKKTYQELSKKITSNMTVLFVSNNTCN